MSNFHRKGQAALEFLTTYGWAFLIILVMIGAISYFGILNPTKFVPERCTASSEITCQDFIVKSTQENVTLSLKQSVGKTIIFNNITCTYDGISSTTYAPTGSPQWNPKNSISTSCIFPANTIAKFKGKKIKILYEVSYTQSTGGFPHAAPGEVFAEVQ